MKYHTLSTSSLAAERKSTLTIYTSPDFVQDKMDSTETAIVRCELEMAQRALKLQTRRCRQLVSEFTRKLQAKEVEIISERRLRDEQLTKVLRSLLVFEARLKQEQTFIRHQLEEKDDIIQRQKKELRGLRHLVQYCNTCSQYYTHTAADSNDSGSEYFNNWESSSELDFTRQEHSSGEESHKHQVYEKNHYNKSKDNYKRCKKLNNHRRTTGTYFEVLKSRESSTESSTEEASSELSDSLKTKEEIDKVSDRIEELFAENSHSYSNKMNNLHGIKSESTNAEENLELTLSTDNSNSQNTELEKTTEVNSINDNLTNEEKELSCITKVISETIPVFETDGEQNDNWYVSGSDQEDDEQRDVYRNNPVLECMNQILLQNIKDPIPSPPKSPELDRNPKNKSQKRVKFSDENNSPDVSPIQEEVETEEEPSTQGDYYETPIQGGANFYEVPQSIYSNDYEQILSKCDSVHSWSSGKSTSPTSKIENIQENKINRMSTQKLTLAKCNNLEELENKNHYYIDMDTSSVSSIQKNIIKKSKLSRTPPALPPKPANLVSKFKIQTLNRSCDSLENLTIDSEPDYCSISELNLPTEKMIMSKTIPSPRENNINKNVPLYDPISLNGSLTSLVQQNVEKNNFQSPKQIKNERIATNVANISPINMLKNKNEPEIPKLPQVSEIIIPEETEEKKKVEHISQDNYIKNNSQLLKQKSPIKNKIMIGTSVSTLVSTFNNQHILSINRNSNPERYKLFSNFDSNQDYEKQEKKPETPSFEKFDLSQNFEEFNLDDCEIGEEYQSESSSSLNYSVNEDTTQPDVIKEAASVPEIKANTCVEIVRATKDIRPHSLQSLQQLQRSLSSQRNSNNVNIVRDETTQVPRPEPSYEHFLECTGLSSKSILTPSRMLSNHKSVLKPKDIKLRSRVKSTAVLELERGGTVKYWSEPYL